jgi:predicted site-specific integrase-resolvase
VAADILSRPLRAALYARVSTNNGQQDPEMQLRELREYAERRGWQIAEVYVDRVSGAKESRPAFNRLMVDAAQRRLTPFSFGSWTASDVRFAIWLTHWPNLKR